MAITPNVTMITKDEGQRSLPFDGPRLFRFINEKLGTTDEAYIEKVVRMITSRDKMPAKEITELLINTALENVDEASPGWTFIASRAFLARLYKQASHNRAYDVSEKYGDFFGLLKTMASKGIYSAGILEKYEREEINRLSEMINPDRDLLFDFPGIHLLTSRYLAKDHAGNTFELPQERWLVIAMHLMQDEDIDKREELVKESYWALSNLYMTVATPTLANAGKAHGQLSSCFIDTVEDSLQGIYDSNTDIARLSKGGGGIGTYVGKVRSRGSSIKGFKGVSSGVVPWLKQLSNTATAVDQLG